MNAFISLRIFCACGGGNFSWPLPHVVCDINVPLQRLLFCFSVFLPVGELYFPRALTVPAFSWFCHQVGFWLLFKARASYLVFSLRCLSWPPVVLTWPREKTLSPDLGVGAGGRRDMCEISGSLQVFMPELVVLLCSWLKFHRFWATWFYRQYV